MAENLKIKIMSNKYFTERPELKPTIYVYEIPEEKSRKGLIKVGYTARSVKQRIKEQLGTSGVKYKILLMNIGLKT